MRTPSIRIALAAGFLASGIMAAGGAGVAQQGQPQAPEVTVYKAPT